MSEKFDVSEVRWSIEVRDEERPFKNEVVFVPWSGGVKNAMMWASKANPNKWVVVTCFSRVRMILLNGEIAKEEKDLSVFYTNTSPEEQHIWREMI